LIVNFREEEAEVDTHIYYMLAVVYTDL